MKTASICFYAQSFRRILDRSTMGKNSFLLDLLSELLVVLDLFLKRRLIVFEVSENLLELALLRLFLVRGHGVS